MARHPAHWPMAVTQRGVGCEQLALLVQSMHPSVGLHCWPPWQSLLPLTPHSELPPSGELAPPHATIAPKTSATVAPQVFMRRD